MTWFCIAPVLWLIIGFASIVYWDTRHDDFTLRDLPMTILGSSLGPIAFMMVIGLVILGSKDVVLFKKRK